MSNPYRDPAMVPPPEWARAWAARELLGAVQMLGIKFEREEGQSQASHDACMAAWSELLGELHTRAGRMVQPPERTPPEET